MLELLASSLLVRDLRLGVFAELGFPRRPLLLEPHRRPLLRRMASRGRRAGAERVLVDGGAVGPSVDAELGGEGDRARRLCRSAWRSPSRVRRRP
jgi:hypothetical protein